MSDDEVVTVVGDPLARAYDYFKHLTTVSLIAIDGVFGLLQGGGPKLKPVAIVAEAARPQFAAGGGVMTFARSVLALLGLAGLAVAPAPAQQNAPTVGRSVAVLAQVPLKSRDGTRLVLGSRIVPGKPTLISIWASWCLPCIVDAPSLNRVRKEFGSRYNFLYINRREGDPDPRQPPAAVAQFLSASGMADVDYLTADVGAYRRILGADTATVPSGLVGIPRVYLFDRNGRQIYASLGYDEDETAKLERLLRQAVAER